MSGGYVAVREYYEDLWERLPEQLDPPDLALRSRFLVDHARGAERALDLGCGDGTFTAILAELGGRPVGVDVAEAALERARQRHPNLEFRRTEVGRPLPFADGEFDLVWASEVIEHIADTAAWLSEIRRVLSQDGRLLLSTASHGRARLALGGIERFSEPLGDHLHLYTLRSLRAVLAEFGFRCVRVRRAGGPPLLRRVLLASARR